MPTDHIIALLIAERDKLNRAIEALQGPSRGVAVRRRIPPLPLLRRCLLRPAKKRKGGPSAAARKAQSQRMKAYWAAKRKKEGGK